MSTPRTDLIAILAEIDQQIADTKDAIADFSLTPADRGRALLDLSALTKSQAIAERALRRSPIHRRESRQRMDDQRTEREGSGMKYVAAILLLGLSGLLGIVASMNIYFVIATRGSSQFGAVAKPNLLMQEMLLVLAIVFFAGGIAVFNSPKKKSVHHGAMRKSNELVGKPLQSNL